MPRVPCPAPHVHAVTADALRLRYPGWKIGFDAGQQVWFAEKHAGTALHYVAADDPAALAIELARVTAKPVRWTTAASGPDHRTDAP